MACDRILKKMTVQKRVWMLVVLLSLMAAHSARAATKTAVPLPVAYSSISGAAVVTWLAVDKGLFAKNNLDVELIYVAGSQAMQSLLSGTTPIGIQGIEPVFRVNAHGSDTVMILGMVTKPPFSIIVRPEIKDYRELKGKPMGITRYGSSTDMLLRLSLEKWGFKPEVDVPILQMGGVPPILAGMESRKIVGGPLSLADLGAGEARRIPRAGGRSGSGSGVSGGWSRYPARIHQAEPRSGSRLRQGDRGSDGAI